MYSYHQDILKAIRGLRDSRERWGFLFPNRAIKLQLKGADGTTSNKKIHQHTRVY